MLDKLPFKRIFLVLPPYSYIDVFNGLYYSTLNSALTRSTGVQPPPCYTVYHTG